MKHMKQIGTRKNIGKNVQGQQPGSGQVPTYYIFITIITQKYTQLS